MATIDDTPESLPPTPKKRRTTHWKAVAKENEARHTALWGDWIKAISERDDARKVAAMWQTTNTLNYRLFKAAVGVAVAGWLVVLWLVVR